MAPATARAVDWAELAQLPLDTPDLVVEHRVLTANIQRAAAAAADGGVALRPHTKTHKLPQVARMQVAMGAAGVQVAKLGEAEVMADAGIGDILVGYPIVGARKLHRLAALAERARVSVSLDSLAVAAGISRIAHERRLSIDVLLEVDTGLHRVGVTPGEAATELGLLIAALPGLRLRGVLTHEGHAYAAASRADLARTTEDACATVADTADRLRSAGVPVDWVSVGSSATFAFAIRCAGVTEVRPGTYVFNDRTQVALGAADLTDVAAAVVATVVSRPAADRAVIDAGSKSLTSDPVLVSDPPRTFGEVLGHPGCSVARVSEEHGVLTVPPGSSLAVGDRVAVLPNHICPAVNLHDWITVVEDGHVVDRWPVAGRGRTQ